MAATTAQQALDDAAAAYSKQQDIVKELRGRVECTAGVLAPQETLLKELKRSFYAAKKVVDDAAPKGKNPFNRVETERLLKSRFFFAPAFEIYGGVAGLYDYGPPGCSVKNNLIALWRQHFVVEEGMLELEATCLTPEVVLKASGHVDKFSDLLVKDVETGDCYRADHLLKDRINEILDDKETKLSEKERDAIIGLRERLDELDEAAMDAALQKHGATAPVTGNALTPAAPFNLMFKTLIGPSGMLPGYLRPETAQGIFVNFKRLSEYMGGRLPFACAQIGLAFRNEISPKAGLLRVREFQQAEIEHFVNPEDKSHPKFESVRDVVLNVYGRAQQVRAPFKEVPMTVGKAVDQGIIGNETLGYFIARTALFTQKIGLKPQFVRFRQHLEHEMAHYAQDCWDLEVNNSYGWTECAGLADRAAYDLSNHSGKSGIELSSREVYAETQHVEQLVCVPNKGVLGKRFRRDAQTIMKALAELGEEEVGKLKTALETDGKGVVAGFEVAAEHISFKMETRAVTGRNFYPSVIEPSFGIGRMLYCLWEHSYYVREESEDGKRAVLGMKAVIAPVKCAVLPLSKNAKFNATLVELSRMLGQAGLISRVDDGGQSIGRRYARADELGTPFGITVDFQSVEDGTVTVRERDSMRQIRCTSAQAVESIADIVAEKRTWDDVREEYPSFNS